MVMPEYTHKDSVSMVGADVVNHMARNINYHNNVYTEMVIHVSESLKQEYMKSIMVSI